MYIMFMQIYTSLSLKNFLHASHILLHHRGIGYLYMEEIRMRKSEERKNKEHATTFKKEFIRIIIITIIIHTYRRI